MRKKIFIIAIFLIILGFGIGASAMASVKFDWYRLDTSDYVTNEYDIEGEFENINIKETSSDIKLYLSDNDKNYVTCLEDKKASHEVNVEDNTLNVLNEHKSKYRFGVHIKSPVTKIYLVKNAYKNLVINSTSADINLSSDFTFENMKIKLTTGDIKCYSKFNEATFEATTGDVLVKNVSVSGNLNINTTTGDVKIYNTTITSDLNVDVTTGDIIIKSSDAKNLYCTATTGDIYASIKTSKKFECSARTGDIKKPADGGDGIFKAKTTTGDITIKVIA